MSGIDLPAFDRYVGIDYAGAETPTASLKGLRVYLADRTSSPMEVQPPPSPRKYWTRRGIAEWLATLLAETRPTLVGIDHGFSFPLEYFETHRLPPDWPAFLDDFQRHWPTDQDGMYVQFVRDGAHGNGAARSGNSRWRRLTEQRAGAKSVFLFDVQGAVAKSTHAGLPWLRYLRQRAAGRVHFWPFDGWDIPAGRSVVAEVYPALWSRAFAREGRTGDQHDAYAVAAWTRQADLDGSLAGFFHPSLTADERKRADIEGWILGVKPGMSRPRAPGSPVTTATAGRVATRRSKTIAIVCTLDTKGAHAQFVARLVKQSGHRPLLVDTGVLGTPSVSVGVPRDEVAREAGTSIQALVDLNDRGKALAAMMAGATALVARLHREGKVDGILGMGGGGGTAIASAVMRGLPFGVPKVMISTMASGEVGRYVGTKDIAMLNSVTDIMGSNPILRRILTNGVGAIVGMVEAADRAKEAETAPPKQTVAVTAFGVTTAAAMRCHTLLEDAGFNTMIFHANGTGGRAMEELIAQGAIDGVLDLTTTELADELCGGKLSAGPHRFEAAGARGLPQVVLPGAMDMVNFGPPETVPPKYRERRLYRHSPTTTLMRTTVDENRILGRWVGEKLAKAAGPSVLMLPLLGFSEYDREQGVFYDPDADRAFMDAAVAAIGEQVPVMRLDHMINDAACADRAVAVLVELIRQTKVNV